MSVTLSPMPRRSRMAVRACWLLWCALGAASCTGSPSEPTRDALEIRSAAPAQGTVLTAGSEVRFTYQVRFTLTTASAIVAMHLLPIVDGALAPPETFTVSQIQKGTTTVTLTETLTLPARCSRVDVLIGIDNRELTSTIISYPVQ
jgi:hypothetical protein